MEILSLFKSLPSDEKPSPRITFDTSLISLQDKIMKNFNNIRKGVRARAEGHAFENLFAMACRRDGLRVVNLPLGAKAVASRFGPPKLIPVRTPFDYIISKQGCQAAFIDAKSISDDRLVYSFLTPHQVDILYDLESDGHKAGYVVHYKKTNRVVFYKASLLKALERRCSYGPEHGEDLGEVFNLNMKGFLNARA